MRFELAVWVNLPSLARWALIARGVTAATMTVGNLAALGLRVRRVPA